MEYAKLFFLSFIQLLSCAEIKELSFTSNKDIIGNIIAERKIVREKQGPMRPDGKSIIQFNEFVPASVVFTPLFNNLIYKSHEKNWNSLLVSDLNNLRNEINKTLEENESKKTNIILAQFEENLIQTNKFFTCRQEINPLYSELGMLIRQYHDQCYSQKFETFIINAMNKVPAADDDILKIRVAWKTLDFFRTYLSVLGFDDVKKDMYSALYYSQNSSLLTAYMEAPQMDGFNKETLVFKLFEKLAKLTKYDRKNYDLHLQHLQILLVDRKGMSKKKFDKMYTNQANRAFEEAGESEE